MNTFTNIRVFYLDGGQSPLISINPSVEGSDVVLENLFVTSLPPANFWKRLRFACKVWRAYMTCGLTISGTAHIPAIGMDAEP